MAEKSLIIHCIYEEEGPTIEEIILDSFRIFLKRELGILSRPVSEDKG